MIDLQHRLAVVGIIVVSLFAVLVLRLGVLQTVESKSLRVRADSNLEARVAIPSTRGRIVDRNGRVLIDNLAINVVTIDAKKLKVGGNRTATLSRLAAVLHVPYSTLENKLDDPANSPFAPAEVARNVKESQVVYIEEHLDRFPAVATTQTWQRVYPNGALAAHVLGYIGRINKAELDRQPDSSFYDKGGDVIGKAGVEKSFERALRGVPGEERITKDRLDRVINRRVVRKAVPGMDIRLSIDINVQRLTEQSLEKTLIAARRNVFSDNSSEFIKAPAGAAVVLDPRNGEVLAMASYPTYDPSEFTPSISPERFAQLRDAKPSPFVNRAIEGQYPPGSTFKLFTGLAAVKAGITTPDATYDDQGVFKLDTCAPAVPCRWHNPNDQPYGVISLRSAYKVSSDTYFYRLGYEFAQLGKDRDNGIQKFAREMGLGERTNIRLPGERRGALPDRAYITRVHALYPKAFPNGFWSLGDTINVAIGQGGILVTPLQIARAYGTFANGGSVVDARIDLQVASRQRMSVAPTTTVALPDLRVAAPASVTTAALRAPRAGSTTPSTSTPPTTVAVTRAIPLTPTATLAPIVSKPLVEGTVDLPDSLRDPAIAGLRDVVGADGGTARQAFAGFPLDTFPIAGKTGTAQRFREQDYAVFVGFGPLPAPKYVVSMVIEEGGFGRQAGAGVRRIFEGLAGLTVGDVRTVTGVTKER